MSTERLKKKPGPHTYGRDRPTLPDKRTADTYAIRVAMLRPLQKGKQEITLHVLSDMMAADTGRRWSVSSLSTTIAGKHRNLILQKALARALGMPLDKAFPIDRTNVAEPDLNTLGGRIRHERERRSWTIIDLAEKMGVTFGAIGHWERGMVIPPPAQLLKLAIVLGVTYHWLHAGLQPRKPQRQNLVGTRINNAPVTK